MVFNHIWFVFVLCVVFLGLMERNVKECKFGIYSFLTLPSRPLFPFITDIARFVVALGVNAPNLDCSWGVFNEQIRFPLSILSSNGVWLLPRTTWEALQVDFFHV